MSVHRNSQQLKSGLFHNQPRIRRQASKDVVEFRKELEGHVEEFLAKGGKIDVAPPAVDDRNYRPCRLSAGGGTFD